LYAAKYAHNVTWLYTVLIKILYDEGHKKRTGNQWNKATEQCSRRKQQFITSYDDDCRKHSFHWQYTDFLIYSDKQNHRYRR